MKQFHTFGMLLVVAVDIGYAQTCTACDETTCSLRMGRPERSTGT